MTRDERNAEMRRLYEDEGWTLAELGDEFGLHQGSVWRVARKEGWVMRPMGPVAGKGRYWEQ